MQNDLHQKSREELLFLWNQFFKYEPPKNLRKAYLIKHISWCLKFDKLPIESQTKIDKLVLRYEKSRKIGALDIKKVTKFKLIQGTKLLREFKGEKHEIIALEKCFADKGKQYKSLSAIANRYPPEREEILWSMKLITLLH